MNYFELFNIPVQLKVDKEALRSISTGAGNITVTTGPTDIPESGNMQERMQNS